MYNFNLFKFEVCFMAQDMIHDLLKKKTCILLLFGEVFYIFQWDAVK